MVEIIKWWTKKQGHNWLGHASRNLQERKTLEVGTAKLGCHSSARKELALTKQGRECTKQLANLRLLQSSGRGKLIVLATCIVVVHQVFIRK